jgi:hypothetical protein
MSRFKTRPSEIPVFMSLLGYATSMKAATPVNFPSEKRQELNWIAITNAADGFQRSPLFMLGKQIDPFGAG